MFPEIIEINFSTKINNIRKDSVYILIKNDNIKLELIDCNIKNLYINTGESISAIILFSNCTTTNAKIQLNLSALSGLTIENTEKSKIECYNFSTCDINVFNSYNGTLKFKKDLTSTIKINKNTLPEESNFLKVINGNKNFYKSHDDYKMSKINEPICVICRKKVLRSNDKLISFNSCGHACLCESCNSLYKEDKCIICRIPTETKTLLYIPCL